jgi:endonuclease III
VNRCSTRLSTPPSDVAGTQQRSRVITETAVSAPRIYAQWRPEGVQRLLRTGHVRDGHVEQPRGVEGLREYIRTIGLFRTKAKNVIALSRMLIAEHGGEVPRTREALEKLPGVGRKTANVVLNVAFGEPTMAVDTHIFRVCNRTGLAPGKDPLAVETKLLEVVPGEFRLHAHHWLILHGRYTCLARTPKCGECLVFDECGFKGKVAARNSASRTPLKPVSGRLPKGR